VEHEDIKFRMGEAKRAFWTDRSFYECYAIPLASKLKRYDSRVRSRFLYGVEGFSCHAGALQYIHKDEGKLLSVLCRSRKRAEETWTEHWRVRKRRARDSSNRPSLVCSWCCIGNGFLPNILLSHVMLNR